MFNKINGQKQIHTLDSIRPFASACLSFEASFELPTNEGNKQYVEQIQSYGWSHPKALGRFKSRYFIGSLYSKLISVFRVHGHMSILSV